MDKINIFKSLVQDVQVGIWEKAEIIEFVVTKCFRSLYRQGFLSQVTGRQEWILGVRGLIRVTTAPIEKEKEHVMTLSHLEFFAASVYVCCSMCKRSVLFCWVGVFVIWYECVEIGKEDCV